MAQAPPPYPSQQGVPPYPSQQGVPPYPTQQGAPPYPTQPPGYPSQGAPPYPPQPGYGAPGPAAYSDPKLPTQQAPYNQGISGGYDSDAEGGAYDSRIGGSFGEKAVRRAFIRKVYGILSCQLLLTCAIISVFTFIPSARLYAQQNRWMYWVGFAATLVCLIAMACCGSVRRKFPTNIIFLGIFTAAEGFMLGSICAYFSADAVLIAAGITCGVTLGLTLFAFQTKIDFTACGGMLCALLMVLMIAGFCFSLAGAGAFGPNFRYVMIGYGSAGALVFSLYIVYDTQLMMGGKHKYSLDPEEYIFAALNIYLDIINLFMYILMIVGATSND